MTYTVVTAHSQKGLASASAPEPVAPSSCGPLTLASGQSLSSTVDRDVASVAIGSRTDFYFRSTSSRVGFYQLIDKATGRCVVFIRSEKGLAEDHELQSCGDPEFQKDYFLTNDNKLHLQQQNLCLHDAGNGSIKLRDCKQASAWALNLNRDTSL
jgi:hypothetical protein